MNGIFCNLFFVSPGQINFLIPYELASTSGIVYVVRDSVAGPPATIPMADTAPGFFEWNGNFALAQHADGTLISASAPAQAGEIIVLYAVGLGHTSPEVPSGHVVSRATSIVYLSELQILLNGGPCPASSIYYAGLTPGFAGLYQINLKLPEVLPPDPLIQIVIGAQASPAHPAVAAFKRGLKETAPIFQEPNDLRSARGLYNERRNESDQQNCMQVSSCWRRRGRF